MDKVDKLLNGAEIVIRCLQEEGVLEGTPLHGHEKLLHLLAGCHVGTRPRDGSDSAES